MCVFTPQGSLSDSDVMFFVLFCFRTVPTTGALQHGWPITSTTRCIHHPVSVHAATIHDTQHSDIPVSHLISHYMLIVSCCSLRGATDQNSPHHILGKNLSALCVF